MESAPNTPLYKHTSITLLFFVFFYLLQYATGIQENEAIVERTYIYTMFLSENCYIKKKNTARHDFPGINLIKKGRKTKIRSSRCLLGFEVLIPDNCKK